MINKLRVKLGLTPCDLLFIGEQSWQHLPRERNLEDDYYGFQLLAVSSEGGFLILYLYLRNQEVLKLKVIDINQGHTLWEHELRLFEIDIYKFYLYDHRGKAVVIWLSEEIIVIERRGICRISMKQFLNYCFPDISLDNLSIVIVEDSNTLVLLDREERTKWRWTSNKGIITFPFIKRDNSVIAVVGVTTLYHFSMEGEILDSWEVEPGLRLYQIGQLDDNHLLVRVSALNQVFAHMIIAPRTRSTKILTADYDVSCVFSNKFTTSPYLLFPSGKIAAVTPSGLVDKPRFPRPKCGKFLRLPEGKVGIYGQNKELIAANSKGEKLWNLNLRFNPRCLVFGMHHMAINNNGKILVWDAIG